MEQKKIAIKCRDGILYVDDTKAGYQAKKVVASMAIEKMYLDKVFVKQLIETQGKKDKTEALIKEIARDYER